MAKFNTFKQFKETFDGFATSDGMYAPKVNRFDSWTCKRTGEKWFFAMDYSPSYGWDGIAAYRADTDQLFTLDCIDGPNGTRADDELPASFGCTRADCEDAMMGC